MDPKTKIKTPKLTHLSYKDYEEIYEPAEDSFLLLDALEKDLAELRSLHPAICLEVGCGSGIISAGLASVLPGCAFLATDVSTRACAASARTARENGVVLGVVRTSVADGLLDRLAGRADLVLCNPPYVATTEEEARSAVETAGVSAAWAGGSLGRNVTDCVIKGLKKLLAPRGRCYMVVEQCNRPDKVVELAENEGLQCTLVLKRRAGRELLFVYKFGVEESTNS